MRYTTVPSFVDTNILVYAEDRDAKGKHPIARDLLMDRWTRRDGVVSVQVLQEFYVTVTQKLKRRLAPPKAREVVEEYLTWRVIENTGPMVLAAIDLQRTAKLSFWDALIVRAAIESDCDRLYSEDLNAGQRYEGVLIVNPFA